MSGHSKWSTIKRQKGTNDQKRGQAFTKLGNAITIAVKAGGNIGDPASNFRLRLAIEKAHQANMPKENIQRAIERAKGPDAGQLEEVLYEGFGPQGMAVLIETATDNRQRTGQEIKTILEGSGGSLAGPGATAHLFKKMGMIAVGKAGKTMEEMMDLAIEAGAEDLEEAGDEVIIYTKPADLHRVNEALKGKGIAIIEAELTFKPTSTVPVSSLSACQQILNFMDQIEDNESVQHVFANFEISDELMGKL